MKEWVAHFSIGKARMSTGFILNYLPCFIIIDLLMVVKN